MELVDQNLTDAARARNGVRAADIDTTPKAWARRLLDPRRFFDVAVTLLVLPFALLVGAVTALAIWLDSPGPVFYWSRRVGAGGQTFRMLKFRKFHLDAAAHPLTLSDDERFTPIGRFLAVTKLESLIARPAASGHRPEQRPAVLAGCSSAGRRGARHHRTQRTPESTGPSPRPPAVALESAKHGGASP
jgi:hypothetical protein